MIKTMLDTYLTTVVAANVACFGFFKQDQKECGGCLLKKACADHQPNLIASIEEAQKFEYQPQLMELYADTDCKCHKCGAHIKVNDLMYFSVLCTNTEEANLCHKCGSSQ